jgi:hypothetical protein
MVVCLILAVSIPVGVGDADLKLMTSKVRELIISLYE